jgi:predicted lysophospholipase L1 biosynthesis ABC-type transport system permease subunit
MKRRSRMMRVRVYSAVAILGGLFFLALAFVDHGNARIVDIVIGIFGVTAGVLSLFLQQRPGRGPRL